MIYAFGDHELDTELFELRCKGEACPIEPQVFDVLAMLLEHRDRLVTKEEILDRVWADRFVTDAALSSRLAAARKAVGDDGRAQKVIKTIHGRGFRFVAPAREVGEPAPPAATAETAAAPEAPPPAGRPVPRPPSGPVIGRKRELERLAAVWEKVRSGSRQTVFVTGEPGLGKTTLVEAFLRHLGDEPRVAPGQCLERRGAGEAYMPVLEALGRLARASDGRSVVAVLSRHAPSWLVQMPGLVGEEAFADLERRALGTTRERMLREMVEAVEVLTAERPLVLVLEDLHWADFSTIELVAWLARRTEPCRLMVLATLRPAELRSGDHPLRAAVQELRIRGLCVEMPAPFLERGEVAELVAARLEGTELPEDVLDLLHRKSGGNPLFVESVLDAWIECGVVARQAADRGGGWTLHAEPNELDVGVPATLAGLIEGQLLALEPDDRVLLEAASVAGGTLSAALVAAAVERSEEEVEERLASLVRRDRFVEERGIAEWPDGTVAGRYGFVHDLYQEFLYDRVSAGRRTRLHRAMGRRIEQAWGDRVRERAGELAVHFVRGRDPERAVDALCLAAEQALRRSAHREASELLETALEQVAMLPRGPERDRRERAVQFALGSALIAIRGWAAPEVERALARACELSREQGEPKDLSSVLCGLAVLNEYRGDYVRSQELLEERLSLPAGDDQETVELESHEILACSTFHQGRFEDALEHAEQARRLYEPEHHLALMAPFGENPGVACLHWAALSLWFLGRPEDSAATMRRALELAEDLDHSFSLAHAHEYAALLHQHRGEVAEACRRAEAALELATAQGYRYRVATCTMLRGWCRVAVATSSAGTEAVEDTVAEGLDDLRRGLEAYRATGAAMDLPHFLGLLADALLRAQRPEEARVPVDEALEILTGRRPYFLAPELLRLRGEILLATGDRAGAEAALREALERARPGTGCGSPPLELRAATSLVRLTGDDGDRRALAELCARFGDADLPYLAEARRVAERAA